ncbi:MAG TPA: DUF58 domain-containing protein [Saprospiraceae bacterium]|jgi:uncharacterized protein (DUF58 family)|nr:DUF58 domain-containing protein [Saprospiraceae bacterium]HMT71766.1 DUF58 domain-containing protein [Saprospiraceae bacterium]
MMDTSEIIKKVRKLEIKTKGLTKHIFSGEYHSAFKGRGMAFSEVRDYQYGDDVRNIDWNVTARTGGTHVKIFEEERELTVMLLIDVSASSYFGTSTRFKSEMMTELAAVIAFSAITNHDKVGAILFSDRIEKYLPPKKGKQNILRIIRELIHIQPKNQGTNLAEALVYLNNIEKKRSIAFVLSDFKAPDYEQALAIAAKKHDIIGIHIFDEREKSIPDVGLVQMTDAETGVKRLVDTSDIKVRQTWATYFKNQTAQFQSIFNRAKCDTLSIDSQDDYIKAMQLFFKKRAKR